MMTLLYFALALVFIMLTMLTAHLAWTSDGIPLFLLLCFSVCLSAHNFFVEKFLGSIGLNDVVEEVVVEK